MFQSSVKCKLYADDVKIYTVIKSICDISNFQHYLDLLCAWSKAWQLSISYLKCCTIDIGQRTSVTNSVRNSCHLDSVTLNVLDNVSDLGVTIDSRLRFSDHIAKISSKAHRRANLIHRCFTSRHRDLLVKAFVTYVRPILEYNSQVWSPVLKEDISLIEAVQKRFTKRIPGLSELSYYSRLKALNIESLELRRLRSDLVLVYKILFGHVHMRSEEFFTLRSHSNLRGHPYVLEKCRSYSSSRLNFFVIASLISGTVCQQQLITQV